MATLAPLTWPLKWKEGKLGKLVRTLTPLTLAKGKKTHVSNPVSSTNVGTNVEEKRSPNVSEKVNGINFEEGAALLAKVSANNASEAKEDPR